MNYNPLIRPNKEIKYDTDEFSQPKKPRIISQLMQLPNCHVPRPPLTLPLLLGDVFLLTFYYQLSPHSVTAVQRLDYSINHFGSFLHYCDPKWSLAEHISQHIVFVFSRSQVIYIIITELQVLFSRDNKLVISRSRAKATQCMSLSRDNKCCL